jgi:hypothetical protein
VHKENSKYKQSVHRIYKRDMKGINKMHIRQDDYKRVYGNSSYIRRFLLPLAIFVP